MAARALWKGAISFGLIHIPAGLYAATRAHDEMSEEWQPGQYHDTYREDLMKAIEEKIRSGRTHTLTRAEAGERAAKGGGSPKIDGSLPAGRSEPASLPDF